MDSGFGANEMNCFGVEDLVESRNRIGPQIATIIIIICGLMGTDCLPGSIVDMTDKMCWEQELQSCLEPTKTENKRYKINKRFSSHIRVHPPSRSLPSLRRVLTIQPITHIYTGKDRLI